MTAASDPRRPVWPWILLGVLLGGGAAAFALWGGGAFREVEEFFPLASAQEIEEWTAQWQRRTGPWQAVPDPPGEGRVVKARYWLSRASYDMEVRRRGENFVVAIAGVDTQFMGGGWAAFGEGRITGEAHTFRGAVATFTWSCLSARFRHASDGVGRIVFSGDGNALHSVYMAYESPKVWAKAYGERQVEGEERPPYASIRGQIPYTPAMREFPPDEPCSYAVEVTDDLGRPLEDALVQFKGLDKTRRYTDPRGRALVRCTGRDAPYVHVVCAGLPGYRNAERVVFPHDSLPERLVIVLPRLDRNDHATYQWNRASKDEPDDVMACGTCHEWYYTEWHTSRHARGASNGHVTWERDRMLKGDPGAPDDCRGCHQPAHAVEHPGATWKARGTMAGNHCDFCHKIYAVTDLRQSGVFGAYEVLRPDPKGGARPGGIHQVFGPLADSTFAYMGAGYNPLYAASHFCAGCHQGGGRWREGHAPKVDTFEEWRRWASTRDNEEFRSCQDCHMPGASTFSTEGKAIDQLAWDGLHRTPQHVHSHRFHGSDPQFAAAALDLDVKKRRDEESGEWIVTVSLTNRGAGHKVPTGTWSKQVVVGVWASEGGAALRQVAGDRAALVPNAPRDQALRPGDWNDPGGFVLGVGAVADAGKARPTPPFWHAWPANQIADQRLEPGKTRTATVRFEATKNGAEPVVEVRVIHRRGWLPAGAAGVPWTVAEYDPPPEVLWMRVVR